MKKWFNKYKYWVPAVLYMVLIFYLSFKPASGYIKLFPIIAGLKIVHLIEYGFMYYLVRYALIKTTKLHNKEIFLLGLFITVLYGLTDEFHQIFVPFRTAKLSDAFANGVGAILVQMLRPVKKEKQL